jgi:hypothetical protein
MPLISPDDGHPIAHAVFTEQLLISRQQAYGWIEALEPLYEILSGAGMSTDELGNMFSFSPRPSLMMFGR